jgi:putative tryptophan/tyrosine transport system substrate-binding protein
MRRREFIAGLGSAAAWSVEARAQQPDRKRRIGVLMGWDENDPEAKAFLAGFTEGLAEAGWTDGRNATLEIRWADNVDRIQPLAKEVIDLQPDVILASTTSATTAIQRETRNIPVVFAGPADPVGAGFVASLARPGGNMTGFSNMEAAIGGKWLQLLTEIEPAVKRAAIMFNPETAPYGNTYFLPPFEVAARSLQVEPIAAIVHADTDIEAVVTALGREPRGGLVVMPDNFLTAHRAAIISLAAQHHVPAIYFLSVFARDGGLLSYGPDRVDIMRRSAVYVDRILRGAKPSDLPVQMPVKFEMTLNARTARTLGVALPQSILLRADEVIE